MFTPRNLVLGFLVLFFFSSLTRNFFEYRRNLSFHAGFKEEYETEQRRNNELKSQLVKTQDPYEMEKTIRNNLNLMKDGEIAVLLPDPTATPVPVTPTVIPPADQWRDLFFGDY
jgi:hypothetical protein